MKNGMAIIHYQGDFYCLEENQSIEDRIRIKQKTFITPASFVRHAKEKINTNEIHHVNFESLHSNAYLHNINLINMKAEKYHNINKFRNHISNVFKSP